MKRLWRYEVILLLLFLQVATVKYAHAQEAVKRWVTGSVIAIDTGAIPNTIVITAKTWKGQDIIVGTQVDKNTEITIDEKHADLKEIIQGDNVSIYYLREPLRLVAKTINVKRR
ncbi:MAG: hypothetical protein PH343_10555 [Nitrospira sp.]|nr:hypothetical protein [Nitrospira sp.]